jgi:hypothetical protein
MENKKKTLPPSLTVVFLFFTFLYFLLDMFQKPCTFVFFVHYYIIITPILEEVEYWTWTIGSLLALLFLMIDR